MAMDVELFEEFSMIAKHGNLSEAARELHVTQPALSRHLLALEKRFGVEFFDRATSPMQLTPEGEVFLHWSSVMSNSYRKMLDNMTELRANRPRVVRVSGLLESSAATVFKMACRSLKEEDPRLAIRLVNDVGQTPFDLIRADELDVSIEPFSGMIDTHELNTVKLSSEQPYALMERSHPLAEQACLDIPDIRASSFVSLRTNKDHANRKHLQDICRLNNMPGDVPGNLETRNSESFAEVLLSGLNGALLMVPESIAKQLCPSEDKEYIALPLKAREYDYDIRLFYSKSPTDQVTRLVERLVSELA